ncbi:MAG: glycosyltransferase 87 family protein [Actinobacteria bacterium]|nr:glycosyltransferase 87 family protein [Actinomycetota bacterium]
MFLIIGYSILLLLLTIIGISKKIHLSLGQIIIFSSFIHLLIVFSFVNLEHYDTFSCQIVGTLTLQKKSLYPAVAYYHYPFFPGLNYIEALSILFSTYGFPYMLFLKLFLSIFNIAIIVLIYYLSKKNVQLAFLYAVNPSMVLLSSAQGQIEVVPFFFSLLAIYLFKRHKEFLTSVSFGFAVMAKVWPLIFLPFFLKYSKKRYMYIISLIIPLISILLYSIIFHASVLDIIHPAISYRGGYGVWGVGIFASLLLLGDQGLNNAIYKSITNISIIVLTFFMLLRKKTNLLNEILIYMLIFAAVIISGANPLWLIPFILLKMPSKWKYWLIIISLYTIISMISEIAGSAEYGLENILSPLITPFAVVLWIINILMAADLFRKHTSSA